jgi:methylthioribose-1-phosphate isomerase
VLEVIGLNESGKISKIRLASELSHARNPAFDVTPAKYVTGIITEEGIFAPGDIKKLINKK